MSKYQKKDHLTKELFDKRKDNYVVIRVKIKKSDYKCMYFKNKDNFTEWIIKKAGELNKQKKLVKNKRSVKKT